MVGRVLGSLVWQKPADPGSFSDCVWCEENPLSIKMSTQFNQIPAHTPRYWLALSFVPSMEPSYQSKSKAYGTFCVGATFTFKTLKGFYQGGFSQPACTKQNITGAHLEQAPSGISSARRRHPYPGYFALRFCTTVEGGDVFSVFICFSDSNNQMKPRGNT